MIARHHITVLSCIMGLFGMEIVPAQTWTENIWEMEWSPPEVLIGIIGKAPGTQWSKWKWKSNRINIITLN